MRAAARRSLLAARRSYCSSRTIAVDRSGLLPGTADSGHIHPDAPPDSLLAELATRIRFRGPLTVADFMGAALTHPKHGYYMRRDVFGREGDFTTSPEVSQVFGELLGVWLVACWEQSGRPPRVNLVEAGPGRGTLVADVLRATSVFRGFHDALSVHLLEVSPFLRAAQRERLGGAAVDDAADGAPPVQWRPAAGGAAVDVHWHRELRDVPEDAPTLLLAHEFLDALPVHQLRRTAHGWRERLVDLRRAPTDGEDAGGAAAGGAAAEADGGARNLDDDPRDLDFVLAAGPTPASHLLGPRLPVHADGAEVSPAAVGFVQLAAQRLARSGGAALVIDYGADAPPADSLRGILRHQFVHPLHAPGEVDLSTDVDFGALRAVAAADAPTLRCPPLATQRDFLGAMGIEPRVRALLERADTTDEARHALAAGAMRLTDADGMGGAYKAFALASADVGAVPGFAADE